MGALGVILSAVDGLVVATDTFPGATGPANDWIRQVERNSACFVYSAEADRMLQAFRNAVVPLPTTHANLVGSLAAYIRANPPAAPHVIGFAIGSIEPNGLGPNSVEEIVWTGQDVAQKVFPGDLMIRQHSIARYLNHRIGSGNLSLTIGREQAVFLIAETRLALPEICPHVAIATVDRNNGFQWQTEEEIARLLGLARQKSRRLALGCVGLF